MSVHGSGRNTLLINLGGGVVTDLGGFAASTYKRGIPFINIPTTLLGMVDAAIGGKTAVNEGTIKNQIGTFALPAGVFIFPGFLATLPAYHLKGGYGEIIKYALIADADLWDGIKSSHFSDLTAHPFNEAQWNFFIKKSIQIKTTLVNEDFKEKGVRAVLNFGHTIGHAMESLSMLPGHRPLSHGHAIALGMICESYLSVQKAGLSSQVQDEIAAVVLADFDPFRLSGEDINTLLSVLQQDKKRSGEEIKFSLIEKPGEARYGIPCSPSQILGSIQYYTRLTAGKNDHNSKTDKLQGK
ncbi:MAG TPA: 3-dehydroquinate synthase family protein, partial [Bacteroidales bacterium]|nr:3-dehydroquinate synthase family protein [Bacteroidales bacterium]